MAELNLAAQPRTLTGRKVRQLRNQGMIPVVVYGKVQKEAESLQVSERTFERILHSAGYSQLVKVDVEGGKTHNVLIRDIQRHPVTHRPMHVDFYAVDLTEKQQVNIPVQSTGKVAAMETGLMLYQALDQVLVEALPAEMPSVVEIDVTNLTTEQPITVADLPAIEGVTYVNDPDEAVFTLVVTRAEEELEDVETDVEEGLEPELVRDEEEDEEGEEEA